MTFAKASLPHCLPLLTPIFLLIVPLSALAEDKSRTDQYGDVLPEGAISRIGTARWRHHGAKHLRYAPDGKTIWSASQSTIRHWDVTSGKMLRELPLPSSNLEQFALSPDWKLLAGYEQGKQDIHVWDLTSAKEVCRFREEAELVGALAFTPDGTRLAIRGRPDTSVRIWDATTGKLICRLSGQDAPEAKNDFRGGLAFSADGQRLASAGENGLVRIWDVKSGTEIYMKYGRAAPVLSGDGKLLALGPNVWEVDRKNSQLAYVAAMTLLFHPDSQHVVTGFDGDIQMRKLGEPRMIWRDRIGNLADFTAFAFSPDAKTLAGIIGSMIFRWDVTTGKRQALPVPDAHEWLSASFSPDGRKLAVHWGGDGVRIMDADTGKEVKSFLHGMPLKAIAFAPDGKALAVDQENEIALFEPATGKMLKKFNVDRNACYPQSVAFSADGTMLTILDLGSSILRIETRTGEAIPYRGPDPLWRHDIVALAPRGEVFARRVGATNDIRVYRTDSRIRGSTISCGSNWGCQAAFSPDARMLAVWEVPIPKPTPDRGEINLYETATGRQRAMLANTEVYVRTLGFSPDGKLFAMNGRPGSILCYQTATGKLVRELKGHEGNVMDIVFSPDGKRLASTAWDSTILVWQVPAP